MYRPQTTTYPKPLLTRFWRNGAGRCSGVPLFVGLTDWPNRIGSVVLALAACLGGGRSLSPYPSLRPQTPAIMPYRTPTNRSNGSGGDPAPLAAWTRLRGCNGWRWATARAVTRGDAGGGWRPRRTPRNRWNDPLGGWVRCPTYTPIVEMGFGESLGLRLGS